MMFFVADLIFKYNSNLQQKTSNLYYSQTGEYPL